MIGPTRHLAELERNLTRLTHSCRDKRKLGGTPRFGVRADGSYDGEWHVCFDSRASWRSPCTAFSFGLGGDWSFEEAMPQRALHPCTPANIYLLCAAYERDLSTAAATALHTRHLGGAVIGASPPARPHKSATIARVHLTSTPPPAARASLPRCASAPPRRRRWPTPRRAESSLSTRLRPRRPSTCPVPWRSRRTRPGRRTAPCPSPLPSVALGGATGALARWLRLCTSPDPYPEPDDTGAIALTLMPTLALARLGRGDPRLRPAPVAAAQPTLTLNQARHGREPPG